MQNNLQISFTQSNTEESAEAINNKKVLDNLREIPFPYTAKDAEEFITATLAADKDTQYSFAITYDGQVVGSIGIFRKDNIHRLTAELGYYTRERKDLLLIRRGFLSSGGVDEPQECFRLSRISRIVWRQKDRRSDGKSFRSRVYIAEPYWTDTEQRN